MNRYIAERHLLFAGKNDGVRKKLTVGICAPKVVAQDKVQYPVDGVMSKCHVELEGLNEHSLIRPGENPSSRLRFGPISSSSMTPLALVRSLSMGP